MDYLFSFEKLDVWKLARCFNKKIHAILQTFPSNEKYNLTNQIQRAASSVALNIAEGCSRSSFKEQARFTEVAFGSLIEVYCSLILAYDSEYISKETLEETSKQIRELSNKLNSLRNSQLNRDKQQNNSTIQQQNNSTNKQINK